MVIYIAIAVIVVVAAIIIYKHKKRGADMAYGLQIFDANEKLIFDLSNKTTYVLGTSHTGTENGSILDSRIVVDRTWVIVTGASADGIIPIFTVESGKISWDFYMSTSVSAVSRKDVTFMYGVF